MPFVVTSILVDRPADRPLKHGGKDAIGGHFIEMLLNFLPSIITTHVM
jgi:hypothetical protein